MAAVYCGISAAVLGGLVLLTKKLMQGTTFTSTVDAHGKVVLITGANTGIGKETARELARRGAKIYMACRNMETAEKARFEIIKDTKNNEVYCLQCDLSSLTSIENCVEIFKQMEDKLHILINNAGVMFCPLSYTENGFETQFGVNHLGHFHLTQLLLDQLKNSAPSRIVVVSSRAHARGRIDMENLHALKSYSSFNAYAQSKLANVLFTRALARRLSGTGITVNALHPGVVDTELFRHITHDYFTTLLRKALLWPFLKTTENGAQTTIYVALEPALNGVTGCYFSDCNFKEVAPVAKDDRMAKRLWAESERLINARGIE